LPTARPLITLTTDFGTADPYVGVMKGVILSINPEVNLVDLSHDVEPQEVLQGAFLVGYSYRFFPPWTIHLVVVDPGVGSPRRPIVLETPQGRFIAPDNGVLSYVLKHGNALPMSDEGTQVRLPPSYQGYCLTNPDYWLRPISSTFHGRDIFAPVAAHLSKGIPPRELGEEVESLAYLPIATPSWRGDLLLGQVVHIDRFGNLVTDIPSQTLAEASEVEVEVCGRRIRGLAAFYGQAEGLLALVGSYDTLEIAVRNGNAAGELGARLGDTVRVKRPSGS